MQIFFFSNQRFCIATLLFEFAKSFMGELFYFSMRNTACMRQHRTIIKAKIRAEAVSHPPAELVSNPYKLPSALIRHPRFDRLKIHYFAAGFTKMNMKQAI